MQPKNKKFDNFGAPYCAFSDGSCSFALSLMEGSCSLRYTQYILLYPSSMQ